MADVGERCMRSTAHPEKSRVWRTAEAIRGGEAVEGLPQIFYGAPEERAPLGPHRFCQRTAQGKGDQFTEGPDSG